uniref:TauD/TfdA-like domain-containing protein n=1 Tax=Leptocylindrus danicus TaxID=163516 RepID=A0A7S2LLC5_9STRA|mmetsp:Transcript_6919/g.10340  ORF Transcript_6919/g.10340 Transcript_6919/m.10340 type:complete len:433 (+) Transcript_6919:162-1460(+)|eukprot:CAMPEP_0116026366 /NCGR_PEP_ID=MMETSP0321-20121206/13785_1 /TAXON_ID=163516 /ORGANISM="Leptocylindrus danicus var. danicus, Strain B650" /LENGTH=432 /DNA_ID=CAMNT_0003499105 /DNA_START=464 /DNA_END=1762 /DNA_ORIENTATION=-
MSNQVTAKIVQHLGQVRLKLLAGERNKVIANIPGGWLREMHASNFDPSTEQKIVPCSSDGKLILTQNSGAPNYGNLSSCNIQNGDVIAAWSDGTQLKYPLQDLVLETKRQLRHNLSPFEEYIADAESNTDGYNGRILWSGLNADDLRTPALSMAFSDVLNGGNREALEKLYKYGILLIKDAPIDSSPEDQSNRAALEKLTANVLGYGPRQTLYGTIWSTSKSVNVDEGASTADSAYTADPIALHTDMTYYRDHAGLQIFCMTSQPPSGGENIFADGFAVGEALRKINPEAFEILSTVRRRYRCIDHAGGWHLEAIDPIISCTDGVITSIRHNNLDRLPDVPTDTVLEKYQSPEIFHEKLNEADKAWNMLLDSGDMRLVTRLELGEMVVVANQRCLHGRQTFVSSEKYPRTLTGAYVGQDDLESRMRECGIFV